MYRAWSAGETPRAQSGGFVLYPYSVSHTRLGPKSRPTSASRHWRFPIVSQRLHGSVSAGASICLRPTGRGYGWCEYASKRAPAARIPRMNVIADSAVRVARGEVAPPATRFAGSRACSASNAGFRRRWTYTRGEFGRSPPRWFGSFQISHMCTHGYRFAAAVTNDASAALLFGAHGGRRPPFAQAGVPHTVKSTAIRCACKPSRTASLELQSYAGSAGIARGVGG